MHAPHRRPGKISFLGQSFHLRILQAALRRTQQALKLLLIRRLGF